MRKKYAILFSIVVLLSLLIFQATYFVVGKQSYEAPLQSAASTPVPGISAQTILGIWWWPPPHPFPKPPPIPTRRPTPTPRPTPTRRPPPPPPPRPTVRPPPPPPPIPSFVICPSGVGHSRCYIDWNALFRWLCQHHYLPTNVCRRLGF